MSEMTNLTRLAQFAGKSALSTPDPAARRRDLSGITGRLDPQAGRRSVVELLGVVMALTARARRMAQPKTAVDLDVFAPGGRRAVRLFLNRRR